ncbi:hypothetical protein [Nodularia chucula]|uniref:hypothetical protein n=1 Tax=Nodularia chucula TaxID=3093667 RepID=UPI0039C63F50
MNTFAYHTTITKSYSFPDLFEDLAVTATFSDFAEICQLFQSAADYYRSRGIKQWNKGYDLEKIYHNISKGEAFIVRNESGVLLCTFAISKKLPNYYPEHLTIESNIWIVKSLCKNLQEKNSIAEKIIIKIIKNAVDNYINKIYLDCVMDNQILERYYQKYGFKRIAIVEHPKYEQNMAVMALNIKE